MPFVGPALPPPLEFLDLEHGESIQLRITKFDMGTAEIHARTVTPRHIRLYMTQNGLTEPPAPGTPITNRVPVLRVWGERLDKPSSAPYWDISSLRLQADLLPRLNNSGGTPLAVTITAEGYKPVKRFSVEVG